VKYKVPERAASLLNRFVPKDESDPAQQQFRMVAQDRIQKMLARRPGYPRTLPECFEQAAKEVRARYPDFVPLLVHIRLAGGSRRVAAPRRPSESDRMSNDIPQRAATLLNEFVPSIKADRAQQAFRMAAQDRLQAMLAGRPGCASDIVECFEQAAIDVRVNYPNFAPALVHISLPAEE
jgi:hypothetical protein